AAFAYVFTWFLLFAGVRPVFELQAQRARNPSPQSDADQLARLTGLPGLLWVVIFALVNLGVTGLGVWLWLFQWRHRGDRWTVRVVAAARRAAVAPIGSSGR